MDDANTETQESGTKKNGIRDVKYGLGAVCLAVVLIGGGYLTGYLDDALDFKKQTMVFGLCAIAVMILGLNIGYNNPADKKLWAIADVAWISLTVVTLGSVLSPVEDFVFRGKVENAATLSLVHYNAVINKTTMAVAMVCNGPSNTAQCSGWKRVKAAIDVPGLTPASIDGKIDSALKGVGRTALTQKIYGEIEGSRGDLRKALETEEEARRTAAEVNIEWQYFTLVLLICVLGFRAGKTGADFAKNKIDKEKEEKADAARIFRHTNERSRSMGNRDNWR